MTKQTKDYISEIYSFAKANNCDIAVAADKLRPEVSDYDDFRKAEDFAKEHYFEIVRMRKENKSMDEIIEAL